MEPTYPGIDEDEHGGMTYLGKIVRDGWLFGLIPETERCAGWSRSRLQILYEKTYAEWEKYGHLPSRLPDEIRQRHERIYHEAIERARKLGWDPELDDDD